LRIRMLMRLVTSGPVIAREGRATCGSFLSRRKLFSP
jgi:hypothetical protein